MWELSATDSFGGNFVNDADGEITEWLKSNPDWTDDGVVSSTNVTDRHNILFHESMYRV